MYSPQYPHEAEVTFPPLTALEVMQRRVKDDVVVWELRPFISSEGMTVRHQYFSNISLLPPHQS